MLHGGDPGQGGCRTWAPGRKLGLQLQAGAWGSILAQGGDRQARGRSSQAQIGTWQRKQEQRQSGLTEHGEGPNSGCGGPQGTSVEGLRGRVGDSRRSCVSRAGYAPVSDWPAGTVWGGRRGRATLHTQGRACELGHSDGSDSGCACRCPAPSVRRPVPAIHKNVILL